MSIFFGAIADDFTGATDLASMLSRAGVPVTLRIGVPDGPRDVTAFEVVALKSRTLPVDEAVAQARAALSWLRGNGAERIFWKYCSTFDSTSRGNIGPVAEALMGDLGVSQTIYCPSFPENGRNLFMGHLFVGDQLLSDSPMKDHPLTPMREADLRKVLGAQTRREVGLIPHHVVAQGAEAIRAALADLRAATVPHVIVDAISADNLAAIAEACHDMTLITGGSAVAQNLSELFAAAGGVAAAKPQVPDAPRSGSLILSGSCSAMTRIQVASYLKGAAGYRLDPLELASEGLAPARRWLKAQPVDAPKIIYATAEPASVALAQEKLGVARAGVLVEDALAQLALEARDMGVQRIVVAGGETSGAVTRMLDVDSLVIGPEIAPGVPWTFCNSEGVDLALTLKSGNFGGPDFFAEALSMLETA